MYTIVIEDKILVGQNKMAYHFLHSSFDIVH